MIFLKKKKSPYVFLEHIYKFGTTLKIYDLGWSNYLVGCLQMILVLFLCFPIVDPFVSFIWLGVFSSGLVQHKMCVGALWHIIAVLRHIQISNDSNMWNQPAHIDKTALNRARGGLYVSAHPVIVTSAKVTVLSDTNLWAEIKQSMPCCMTVTIPHPYCHGNCPEALIKQDSSNPYGL